MIRVASLADGLDAETVEIARLRAELEGKK